MADPTHPIQVITTEDGSFSLFDKNLNETYHSRHGARQESMHVFIQKGFEAVDQNKTNLRILEVGFGTGLNAFLTYKQAIGKNQKTTYHSLDTFPLPKEIYVQLAYSQDLEEKALFEKLHTAEWDTEIELHEYFRLKKIYQACHDYMSKEKYHLVYFDAFGPPTQPEMWTKQIFEKIRNMMEPQGIFVTYCAKGQVRRDLQSSGFVVERLEGPPGKREMLRAIAH